jgi:type IV pilus assembly protein PilQ
LGVLRSGVEVDAELSLLAAKGQARVLAKPKILTIDQSPASIQSGVQIPYQETSRSGATSTAFRNALLSLHVLPQITPDQKILLQLQVKQDTVGTNLSMACLPLTPMKFKPACWSATVRPWSLAVFCRRIKTTLNAKLQVLGDLPVLGRLFKRKIARKDQQELLIFHHAYLGPVA